MPCRNVLPDLRRRENYEIGYVGISMLTGAVEKLSVTC